jgi:hypothetical protein
VQRHLVTKPRQCFCQHPHGLRRLPEEQQYWHQIQDPVRTQVSNLNQHMCWRQQLFPVIPIYVCFGAAPVVRDCHLSHMETHYSLRHSSNFSRRYAPSASPTAAPGPLCTTGMQQCVLSNTRCKQSQYCGRLYGVRQRRRCLSLSPLLHAAAHCSRKCLCTLTT